MKNNKLIYSLSILMLAGSLVFTSCKKKKEFKNEDGQSSTDNRTVQSENDAAVNEINSEVGNSASMRGKSASPNGVTSIKGALGIKASGYSVDTISASLGKIKIKYDGTTVNNRTRTGTIVLTLKDYSAGKRWKMKGSVLQVDFVNYKVVRASDGKSVELNGTQYLTNETGGTWWELLVVKTQSSLASSVTGTDLNVTFDDGKTAVYNINRKFTYTVPGSILTCTGEGIGTSDGLGSLENYGTTRDGDAFTSQVTTPIIWNWTCGAHAPIQGEVNIKVKDKEFDLKVLFSVDASGSPVVAAANSCPYGWKVEWTYKKKTNKKVFGYY